MNDTIKGRTSAFTNKPIFNKEEAMARLFTERMALTRSDLPIKTKLNYWSETTGECHCFPIFNTDTPLDVMTRYSDVFPMEYEDLVQEVKNINLTSFNNNGMSKEGLNMAKMKIPLLVYRAIDELNPNFWDGEKGLKWFEDNIKPLKVGYGRT